MVDMSGMIRDKVKYMFELSDRDGNGRLDKDEFGELLHHVNPDSGLSGEQVELIVEEIWAQFGDYVDKDGGLLFDGLIKLYSDGYADLQRDYELILEAYRPPSKKGVADREGAWVEQGMLGEAVQRQKQDALGGKVVNKEVDDVKELKESEGMKLEEYVVGTGLEQAQEMEQGLVILGVQIEDPSPAKTLEDIRQDIFEALQDGLPLRSTVTVLPGICTYSGYAYGVSCVFDKSGVQKEELEYLKAVLEAEPEQIFPVSLFGDRVKVIVAKDCKAEGRFTLEIAESMAECLKASEMMGAPEMSSFSCVFWGSASNQNSLATTLLNAFEESLPNGSAAKVAYMCRLEDGTLITIGGRAPIEKSKAANAVLLSMKNNPKSAFNISSIHGKIDMIAEQSPLQRGTVIFYEFKLKNQYTSKNLSKVAMDLLQDTQLILPPGSLTELIPTNTSHRKTDTIQLVAKLPDRSKKFEVDSFIEAPKSLHEWSGAAHLVASIRSTTGDALIGCQVSGENGFGLSYAQEYEMSEDQSETPGGSNSRKSRSPFSLSKIFGRRKILSPDIPDHEGPLPLSDSDEEYHAHNDQLTPPQASLIAGYQRRSPTSSGSSGLADALDNYPAIDSQPADDPLKDEAGKLSTTVISVHAFPSSKENVSDRPRDNVDMDIAVEVRPKHGQAMTNDKSSWKSFLRSISPKKKRKSKLDTIELDAETKAKAIKESDQIIPSVPEKLQYAEGMPDDWKRRENARLAAIIEANIKQIISQAEHVISSGSRDFDQFDGIMKAISLLPPWAAHSANMEVAEILASNQRYQEAMAFLHGATASLPEDPLAFFRLGNAHFALEEYETASRMFFESLKRCAPNDTLLVKVHINMGISLESQDMLAAAEREYCKASRLAPNHPRVFKLLGSTRYAIRDYEGAVEALGEAIKITPDFADAWVDLGCSLMAVGEREEGIQCLEKALALDSDHVEAHFNIGNVMRDSRKPKEALKHYNIVLSQEPEHPQALLGKAVSLHMLEESSGNADGEYRQQAILCLQKCMSLCDPDDDIMVYLGTLHRLISSKAHSTQVSAQMDAIQDAIRDARSGVQCQGTPVSPASFAPEISTTPKSDNISGSKLARSKSGNQSPWQSDLSATSRSTTMSRNGDSPRKTGRAKGDMLRSKAYPVNNSYDRLSTWSPPSHITKKDVSKELLEFFKANGGDPDAIFSSMDVSLLQQLQPLTCLTLDSLRSEMEILKRWSGRQKTKGLIHVEAVTQILTRLLAPRSPPHLLEVLLSVLGARIFQYIDFDRTGYVSSSMLWAILTVFVDAPVRNRLETAYYFLMPIDPDDGMGEKPITRNEIIEYISILKAMFEADHRCDYLRQKRTRVHDSQFVMLEKFAADVQKFFSVFKFMPILCNPLK